MFTHVMVGSNDIAKATQFYDATFGALGVAKAMGDDKRAFYRGSNAAFGVVTPADGAPACHANGGTIGLGAPSKDVVDAWHAAGIANGGVDEGAPGVRENSPGAMYGAYLRDPDGNKLCVFAPNPGTAA
ncbi:MAG: glyoxalase [Sphingomonas bacterium]|jgi:catechol 2,3-dioxygenase-like lactoylglutathione lyase family enzyme|nr:glyoxalase [Sphingomonas bacterium]MDB5684327.1 glyoxalase [Sphingomonas bacterium]MDB5717960.1 glyoxalase [Sphingomonas bacterium]